MKLVKLKAQKQFSLRKLKLNQIVKKKKNNKF